MQAFILDVHHTGALTVTNTSTATNIESATPSVASGLILLMIGVCVSVALLVMLIFP